MNKIIFTIFYCFCFFTWCFANENEIVKFRYMGFSALSPDDAEKISMRVKTPSHVKKDLGSKLKYWRNKLIYDVYLLEKSLAESGLDNVHNYVKILNADIHAMSKEKDADIFFRSCYPIVLESVARMLQSRGSSTLTMDILEASLAPELLLSPQLRYLQIYAQMLLLTKAIYLYESEHERLPNQLSQTTIRGNTKLFNDKINYAVIGNQFYLWVCNGKSSWGTDDAQYVPAFINRKAKDPIVFSSNFSALREKLWKQGFLQFPLLKIELNRNSGTLTHVKIKQNSITQ